MVQPRETNEAIIIDALGRLPDVQLGSESAGWHLCRWRQFVGSYSLPPLPDPAFTVHIAGKPLVKTWDRDGWSEIHSVPGCATIVPAGQPTGWLVDGELDVVTLSMSSEILNAAPAADQFRRMRFAFSDPLGVALTRQVLAELYAPASPERDIYVGAMVNALKAHILRGPNPPAQEEIPVTAFSAYRLHHIMGRIQQRPQDNHTLEEMAAQAGVTPSHFCRIFRKATGVSPHQYVMKARLDRAQHLLVQSDMALATIADFLGFTSQSHFTRAFRQFTGEPPSDFRKRGRTVQ
ncbi:AraC family transcriptional regulator [Sphingobium sufflavum]|jgi:AraC family transcriptional regulator|uniref:helix-turn-helix transcriptional regulator n=1 Tax=Sphingobium sufflavum TaxID=1129547 RepID=UPI001F3C4172|nr:AraC family transcriptional regulator [Sphingobium sufflavum]MCE7795407.1 AraC family transcriptional regulator [Sphingobium sufflavum]